jgi:hypothetical protein
MKIGQPPGLQSGKRKIGRLGTKKSGIEVCGWIYVNEHKRGYLCHMFNRKNLPKGRGTLQASRLNDLAD